MKSTGFSFLEDIWRDFCVILLRPPEKKLEMFFFVHWNNRKSFTFDLFVSVFFCHEEMNFFKNSKKKYQGAFKFVCKSSRAPLLLFNFSHNEGNLASCFLFTALLCANDKDLSFLSSASLFLACVSVIK